MPIKITMPALSPTMEEGNLTKWNVKEGDKVQPGDVIAEIETDKATMEVESADEGTVAKIVIPEGTQGVKVNSIIAILAEDGETAANAIKTIEAGGASAPALTPAAATLTTPASVATTPATAASTAAPAPIDAARNGGANRVFASPLARRLAKQGGFDITSINGSGPYGRIIKSDVDAALLGGAKAALTANSLVQSIVSTPSDEQVLKLFKKDEYELVPHDGMRKVIAKRLVESKQNVPHFYVTIDCEIDALLKLRSQLNAAAPQVDKVSAYRVSVNDMVIKATALALKTVPDANVSWLETEMIHHKYVDVGVAVSIPNGLITPIVRHADEKPLSIISNEMKDLAYRARERKLKPEEYQGGSTSVSNMGMFDVKNFAAIINPPQSTIFAIGSGEKRAVVKDDIITIATVMTVTISTDHRCVDGALAARLAQVFKGFIENPISMLV